MCAKKFIDERPLSIPVDLKTRKSTGTSCQTEIHFSMQIIKFLINIIYFVRKYLADL